MDDNGIDAIDTIDKIAGMDRRDFLKGAAAASLGLTLGAAGLGLGAVSATGCAASRRLTAAPAPATTLFAAPPLPRVRMGFIGVGGQGSNHVNNFLRIPNVEIRAVCDIVEEKVTHIQDLVEKAGQPRPEGYSRGPQDFRRLCERGDLDLVFIATPWEWHTPMCVAALEAGKHAATEVPAAVTVDECWQLVEVSERTRRHCVMMENCCYGRSELMMLNMARRGALGELLHGEGGYLHDLRAVKFANEGEGLWRRAHAIRRNGNLYPTHGLGPLAQCMNVNRGDQFDYMVSLSGNSRGLQAFAAEHLPAGDPRRQEHYKLGDVNSTLIRTKNGRTIFLKHDTNLPRPYSRLNYLQGTKGIISGYPDRVYLEGRSPNDDWEPAEKYYTEFDHPLWVKMEKESAGAGHGGMDFIEDWRLIECLRAGAPTDQNVYDAAAWSVVSALSEQSVTKNGRPVDFPDFTRGRWETTAPLGIVEG